MHTYTFTTLLENYGPQQLLNRFVTMKGDERLERGQFGEGFNEDSYEWLIGSDVFKRLKNVAHMYGNLLDEEKHTFLGIRMYFLPCHPNDVILRKKESTKRLIGDITTGYSYVDTDTVMPPNELLKMELNKQFGCSSMRLLKKKEKRMNTPSLNQEELHHRKSADPIKKAIFNDPATIVYWKDGTKTVVMAKNEPFDPEKGLAMAFAKRFLGNQGNYYNMFRKWMPEENHEDQASEKTEPCLTELLTSKQLAEKMRLSISTVLRDCRKGLYPGAVKVDGKWLIPYSGVTGGDKNDK